MALAFYRNFVIMPYTQLMYSVENNYRIMLFITIRTRKIVYKFYAFVGGVKCKEDHSVAFSY